MNDKMTIEKFGATIKSKYPAYSSYSDTEIGQKMLDKYPQYASKVQTPTFVDKFTNSGHAVIGDIIGAEKNKSNAFLPSVIRSTIGSEGISGVVQNYAKVGDAKNNMALSTDLSQTQEKIRNQAADLLLKAKNTTDSLQKEKYKKIAQDLLAHAGDLQNNVNNLDNSVPTQGQIAGTTANALLTVATGAKPNFLGEASPRFASLAKNSSFINKGAKATYYAGRAVENAALGTAYTAASNLNEGKDIGTGLKSSAALSALIPLGAQGVIEGKNALLNKASSGAETIINSLIKPLQKDFAYGKNPAAGIIKEGITANSLPELGQKVTEKTQQVGDKIGALGQHLEGSGLVSLNLTPALAPIDSAIQKAAKNNNITLFNSLQNVKVALMHDLTVGLDEKGAPSIIKGDAKNLISAGYDQAKTFLSDIAEHTRFTGNVSDDKELNMATKQAYGITRDIMNKGADSVDPRFGAEMRDLNSRYGDLLSAKNAIAQRDIIEKRQSFLSLANKFSIPLSIGSAMAVGFSTGDWGKAGAILAAEALGQAAVKAGGSATVKTRVAQFLSKLAPEERNGILNSTPVLKNLWERLTGQKATENPTKPEVLNTVDGFIKTGTLMGGAGASAAAVVANQPNTFSTTKTEQPKVNPEIDNLKKEVAFRESGVSEDPYQTIHKNATSTDYGKYQINEKTLKSYGKKFLGKDVSPEEFLTNPDLQEQFTEKAITHLKSLGVKSQDAILIFLHRGWGDISSKRLAELRNDPEVKKYLANKPK